MTGAQGMNDDPARFSIGLLIDTAAAPPGGPPLPRDTARAGIEQMIEEGVLAEDAGFEGVFVPEHHMRPETAMPDALVMLAALAGRTQRIRLATSVLAPGYGWNPMHLAEATAVIDQLSRGRLTLMLGQGNGDESFRMFGVDPKLRIPWLMESVEIIRRVWSAREPFSHVGPLFKFDRVWLTPKPFQQDPHPPIWAAADTDKAVGRIASFASGWCSAPFPVARDDWRRRAAQYREAAKRNGIANPRVVLIRDGCVAETRAEAEKIWSQSFVPAWRSYFDAGVLKPPGSALRSREDLTFDTMRPWCVVGTPADCIEALERYRDDWGCDTVILRLRCGFGPSREATARAIRLCGEQVLPHFNR